jgi:anti-sigma factor RsiW
MKPADKEDPERLVAYLDGELSEEEAREVEIRLNRDPTTRAEAEALRRTWDLLDYLPRPEPSPSFTHRTLERVTGHVSGSRLSRGPRHWPRRAAVAAAFVLALLGGYLVGFALLPYRPSEKDLVRDLRLIENFRLYEHVDSLDFLRELNHPDLFGDDPYETGE